MADSKDGTSDSGLTIGVMGRSRKENERRLALHPAHLAKLPPEVAGRIYLEEGYGAGFGVGDDELAGWVAGLRNHESLVAECDVILQPKPVLADLAELRRGQVFWGYFAHACAPMPFCWADAPPSAQFRIFSSVASARVNSPAMRPSRMTMTRSLMPRISGSSEEIIRMAAPRFTSSPMS